MRPPDPMLSTSVRSWPDDGNWVLEPKFDGFRLLVEVGRDRRARAWSRHGANLSGNVGDLLGAFADVPAGTVLTGN